MGLPNLLAQYNLSMKKAQIDFRYWTKVSIGQNISSIALIILEKDDRLSVINSFQTLMRPGSRDR